MSRSKKRKLSHSNYLIGGIRFLRSVFDLPFYGDLLQIKRKHGRQTVTYRIPLEQEWLNGTSTPDSLVEILPEIHESLGEALIWTHLGTVDIASKMGMSGDFFPADDPAFSADWILTGSIDDSQGALDTFKGAMVLVLTLQIGLATHLSQHHVRHGHVMLPLDQETCEAIASVLQTAADPTLEKLADIAEHYSHSWCSECAHFRASSAMPGNGSCEWAQTSIPDFLSASRYDENPLWRVFVTHPHLITGVYNADEREEAALQYRDRVAQWFDEEDQVTLDPITLHLIEDVLHAAKTEDELQDTDTVLPRALRLMDYWHSGYLPSSGETHPENPTLVNAMDKLPDALLPLVLSSLTLLPPQYACIGFLPDALIESEVGSLMLGIKPLRDVLIQAIPRRVLELLASSFAMEDENINVQFMRYLHEQVSISFERIMMDYEVTPMTWLFEPLDFYLTDVLYIQARLSSFIREVTLEAIRRVKLLEG